MIQPQPFPHHGLEVLDGVGDRWCVAGFDYEFGHIVLYSESTQERFFCVPKSFWFLFRRPWQDEAGVDNNRLDTRPTSAIACEQVPVDYDLTSKDIRYFNRYTVTKASQEAPNRLRQFGLRRGPHYDAYCRALAGLLERCNNQLDPQRITDKMVLECQMEVAK